MKTYRTLLSTAGTGLLFMAACSTINEPDQRPNIIYILADDLGYGDLGCYGQTMIETPNIDRLAAKGMIFTDHYSASPVCAPARCMLLTGKHAGNAYIRANDSMTERGDVWDFMAQFADSTLEGQRPLPAGTRTLGHILQDEGYKTGIFGKWGLGTPDSESIPTKMGFDYFYGYICQIQAHTYFPLHLYRNENRVFLNNDTVPFHTGLNPDEDPFDIRSYDRFLLTDYAPDLIFNELTGFVAKNHSEPFFVYWATPLPHLPLQAPWEWVEYYRNIFGDEEPYAPIIGEGRRYFPHRYPRAAYAAMISYLDHNVGILVQQLKDLGTYDNTLIMFSSDNGPASPSTGGADTRWFESAAPFHTEVGRVKGSLSEGGIRVPMIAHWPGVVEPGRVTAHPSVFYDVLPTICDIIGADVPSDADGLSFLPELKGEKQASPDFLYWEYIHQGGQMVVRIGHMKAIRNNMQQGNLEWELYNLHVDPREENNIASAHPELIARADEIARREHTIPERELFRFRHLEN